MSLYVRIVAAGRNIRSKQCSRLKNKKKKIRMLNSLANYLLGGNNTGRQGSREGSNNQIPEACPVMARLRQVEVEGEDWILIDRAGEGALEESWYLTPPPCFTRAGPVNVETSPLEDLLIEHPSMSVYRATASPVAPETPPPTPDAPDERNVEENEMVLRDVLPDADMSTPIFPEPNLNPRRRQTAEQENIHRQSIHDGRPAAADRSRRTEQRIQLRSAQKVLEKRSTQSLKKGRLERSNKLREVFSVKGKRPRRQDRLRIQNSGANNNRKC